MELAPQQAKAVDLVAEWFKTPIKEGDRRAQYFYLGGYAGTGKTTIAKYLLNNLNLKKGVAVATFTGKAASVMSRKGLPCSTIHSLIYEVVPPSETEIKDLEKKLANESGEKERAAIKAEIKEKSRPRFELNLDSRAGEVDLIVIDEVSMVDEVMGADLLSFGTKILVLGDPGQLPPVRGTGYFTSGDPNFTLTEIHRQAAGNPIISMATLVRKGNRLRRGLLGESRVISRNEASAEYLVGAAQVICGRNATRKSLNSTIRDKLKFEGSIPLASEKVICLRNNKELGILNGTQWIVDESSDRDQWLYLKLKSMDYPDAKPIELEAHHFNVDLEELPFYIRANLNEFDFGYAITCHKSQGSQWPSVFIQDESWIFAKSYPDMPKQWLYTALTRAEEKVVVAI